MSSTDAMQILADFDGGVFASKIAHAIKAAANGSVNNAAAGKVTIELAMTQVGTSRTVNVKHTIKYVEPTVNGKLIDEDTTETPIHVLPDGNVTVIAVVQGDLWSPESQREGATK